MEANEQPRRHPLRLVLGLLFAVALTLVVLWHFATQDPHSSGAPDPNTPVVLVSDSNVVKTPQAGATTYVISDADLKVYCSQSNHAHSAVCEAFNDVP